MRPPAVVVTVVLAIEISCINASRILAKELSSKELSSILAKELEFLSNAEANEKEIESLKADSPNWVGVLKAKGRQVGQSVKAKGQKVGQLGANLVDKIGKELGRSSTPSRPDMEDFAKWVKLFISKGWLSNLDATKKVMQILEVDDPPTLEDYTRW